MKLTTLVHGARVDRNHPVASPRPLLGRHPDETRNGLHRGSDMDPGFAAQPRDTTADNVTATGFHVVHGILGRRDCAPHTDRQTSVAPLPVEAVRSASIGEAVPKCPVAANSTSIAPTGSNVAAKQSVNAAASDTTAATVSGRRHVLSRQTPRQHSPSRRGRAGHRARSGRAAATPSVPARDHTDLSSGPLTPFKALSTPF